MHGKVRAIGAYSALIGIAYMVYGLIEILEWMIGTLQIPLSPSPDIFAGFILIIIGTILIYRIGSLLDMKYEGLSFLFVGLVLSAIIGIMYILIMGADALDALVVGEPWNFDPTTYNLPAIVLFILLLPGWLIVRDREGFGE